MIHHTAEVHQTAQIGKGTNIWNNCQIRENAVIGAGCNIGSGVYIDAGVRIGDGCKIQNNACIFHGATLENDVFIGPCVCFTNDKHPRAFNKDWKVVETKVGRGASIGANSTIVCGVNIGEFAMVGAGSVVTKDLEKNGLYYGCPATKHGEISEGSKKDEG